MVNFKVAPEEPVNGAKLGSEEIRVDLEPFLQKLIAEFDALVYEWAPGKEFSKILRKKRALKRLKTKKLELKRVNMEQEETKDPENCCRFEIGIGKKEESRFKKDEKDETKKFEVGTRFDQKNHEPLQVVEKVTDEVSWNQSLVFLLVFLWSSGSRGLWFNSVWFFRFFEKLIRIKSVPLILIK
ncbi:hypothetical protein C2G38_2033283 [Gigaspora rosea]|uniref:Uncharacterized protein n=1 Tax=Gigaspora rosea TaxID=44941 RepID=A0A397VLU0_9GLOM|nr:hypothetical protein C2G38_2033283 [Gigaspora rosea]